MAGPQSDDVRASCPLSWGWQPREPARQDVLRDTLVPGWQAQAGTGGGGGLPGWVTSVSDTRPDTGGV